MQFNPSKPNKFHIKLFMVSEHKTGYMAGFSVYTGQVANELVAKNAVSSKECATTTKTVMGLLQRTWLLDNYRSVSFDNWFNLPQLLDEMYNHKTLGAGTVRQNCEAYLKLLFKENSRKGKQFTEEKGISYASSGVTSILSQCFHQYIMLFKHRSR